jgi:hypothetical protein
MLRQIKNKYVSKIIGGLAMKGRSIKLNRKLIVCVLIFSIILLPISSSICFAEDAANTPAGASPGSSAGVAAAGSAGSGGLAGLSTVGKIGIAALAIGVVAVIVAASDDSTTTTAHH